MIQRKTAHRIVLAALAAAMFLPGCIRPGHVEANDHYRLQEAIRQRSPQTRPDKGASLARPRNSLLAKLPVKTWPHGRKTIALSLDQAVQRALANNPQIAVVSFTPALTREQVVQAAAEFDVTLFGGYSYSRNQDPPTSMFGATDTSTTQINWGLRQKTVTGGTWELTNSFSRVWDNTRTFGMGRYYNNDVGLSLTQPLLRDAWPDVNLAGVRIARLNHKSSLSEFRRQVEEILTQTTTAYYQLLQTRENVAITQRLYKRTQETFKRLEARKNLDATKVQRKQAEAASKDAYATLLLARKSVTDAQDALVKLLGDSQLNMLSGIHVIPTTKMTSGKLTIDASDQIVTALKHSPLLEQIRLAIQQSNIRVLVAKNSTLPRLDLVASVGTAGGTMAGRHNAWNEMSSADYVQYTLGVQFEYPLGNRLRDSQLREARLARRQSIASLQATADDVAQLVRERVRRIATAQKEIVAREETAAAYREELTGLEDMERIRAQLTPEFLNLKLQAQRQVAASEQKLVQAIYEYNTAIIELSRATGTVLDTRRVQLAIPAASETGAK